MNEKLEEQIKEIENLNVSLEERIEEIEEAKIAEMHKWARYEQDALAIVANAARLELRLEHRFDLNDLLDITSNNPFIPSNRELIFARGFQFGFQAGLPSTGLPASPSQNLVGKQL